jgi:TPR repeat protein
MHDVTEHVPQNEAEAELQHSRAAIAAQWYRRAADQGYVRAQVNLGLMYDTGIGVEQSDVQAYVWFALAAAQGDSAAVDSRNELAARMSPAQIAEAQKLVAEFGATRSSP